VDSGISNKVSRVGRGSLFSRQESQTRERLLAGKVQTPVNNYVNVLVPRSSVQWIKSYICLHFQSIVIAEAATDIKVTRGVKEQIETIKEQGFRVVCVAFDEEIDVNKLRSMATEDDAFVSSTALSSVNIVKGMLT